MTKTAQQCQPACFDGLSNNKRKQQQQKPKETDLKVYV